MLSLIAQAAAGVEGFDEPADVVLAPTFVTFLVTLLLPVLVALVTKAVASDRLRAVILLVLTAITTLIGEAIVDDGSAIISKDTFMKWVMATLIAVASYLGFWKPVANINAKAAPAVGLNDTKAG